MTASTVRTRYYLSMLSMFLIVYWFDATYAIVSGQYDLLLKVLTFEVPIFIVLNLAGAYFLFRPVDRLSSSNGSDMSAYERVASLPLLSAAWICILGSIYAFIVYSMMFSLEAKTYIVHLYDFVAMLLIYGFINAIFIFFVISNYAIYLREHIYTQYGYLFPPQRVKIWHKFLLVLLCFAFLFASMTIDLYLSGAFAQRKAYIDPILDLLLGFPIIIIIMYLISRDLRRPLALILNSLEAVGQGNYTVKTPVVSDDELGILSSSFNQMAEGLQERELIRDTFGKYVTKTVADQILNNKVNLSGDVRLVTILFSDIENYTTLSENMKPEDVVTMLNDYFSCMVSIITKHGGIVNKFIGDAILAIFNAPIDDRWHARNAIQAALEMQDRANDTCFGNQVRLRTRIGINTGIIVVGNIGSLDRLEYTAIGDEVNVASRLEQLNKSYGTYILVGDKTRDLARDDFHFERIGEIQLKGKSKAIEVFTVAAKSTLPVGSSVPPA